MHHLVRRKGPQGTCESTTYSDGTWSGVDVQAIIEITLKSYTTTVRLSDKRIIQQLGQQCRWWSEHCRDDKDGHTYWNPNVLLQIPKLRCTLRLQSI